MSSSGKDFIKRGMDSRAARASSSVGLGLGTGPEAILVKFKKQVVVTDVGPVFLSPL